MSVTRYDVGVWLNNPSDISNFDGIVAECFRDAPPARACVQSSMMVDCKVEVDCVAYHADRT